MKLCDFCGNRHVILSAESRDEKNLDSFKEVVRFFKGFMTHNQLINC